MKPSVRFMIGKAPFRIGISLPIEDLIGNVVSGVASLISSTIAQEETPQPKSLTTSIYPHILVHAGGEIDIQPCTDEQAVDAVRKTLKLMDLKDVKLYRVEGDQRILVAS